MAFWENRMPAGMFLRSNWAASHIADPNRVLTLDSYRSLSSNHMSAPIKLERFVDYGRWYQQQAVPGVEKRNVTQICSDARGFKLTLEDGGAFTSRRVVIATGIGAFSWRPAEFDRIPPALASHSSEHRDLSRFKGQRIVVIGGGQSALESAALLHEAGAHVEVIVRQTELNWVGLHSWLHRLSIISRLLYSKRDVGPAGISRLVSLPHLFRRLPRNVQSKTAYRAIRPAGSAWLRPRLTDVQITLGRKIVAAFATGSQLRLALEDGSNRLVDHALLATGFRVDTSRYEFFPEEFRTELRTANGYPILKRGFESSIPGLHFLGKPAAWSFGPLLCFVSGTEFASRELVRSIAPRSANNDA